MSTDYWLVPSLRAPQIQTPFTTEDGKFAEIAKERGGPWPRQLWPAGETPITRSSSSRSGLTTREEPVAKWQMCDREIKISTWEAYKLKLEFTPTIFIADTTQDKPRSLFWIIWLASYLFGFILYQLNFVTRGEALSGNSLLIT